MIEHYIIRISKDFLTLSVGSDEEVSSFKGTQVVIPQVSLHVLV